MKILIYRISSIGDILLTTPVVRCLRKALPDAQIHFITRRKYKDLLDDHPDLDKLWLVEHSPLEIADDLKREHYDLMIDLHRNIRSIRLWLKLRVKRRTFPKLNIRKWLLTSMRINVLPDVHITDRYFRAVQHLGVRNDGNGLSFFLPDTDESLNSRLPAEPYVVLALGGTFKTKRYPADLCSMFIELSPYPIVLLGGETELNDAREMAALSPQKTINLCAELSLKQSAQVINQAAVVVANDTGMMHLASALKKPLVSIWGSTIPAFGMYPCFPSSMNDLSVIVENNNLKCRPCSKLGFDQCPKGHFRCMRDIQPEIIIQACVKLMNKPFLSSKNA